MGLEFEDTLTALTLLEATEPRLLGGGLPKGERRLWSLLVGLVKSRLKPRVDIFWGISLT